MPIDALLLVLFSAAIHVGWNAVARAQGGGIHFAWTTSIVGLLVLAPLSLWQRATAPSLLDARVVALAALSGLFEALAFVTLALAYRVADLSVVYPVARGIAPLLALLPGWWWSGDTLTLRTLAGVGVVAAGALSVARSATSRGNPAQETLVADATVADRSGSSRIGARVTAAILLNGATIAAYHLVDRQAQMGPAAPNPIEYVFLMQVVQTLLLLALARAVRSPSEPASGWRTHWRSLLIAGVAMQVAYFLVLLALRHSAATFVMATRNVGIPMSLLVGALFLRERVGPGRIAGALLIVSGIFLLVK